MGWLTGWPAACLTASPSAVCLAMVWKCCPGARGRARSWEGVQEKVWEEVRERSKWGRAGSGQKVTNL